MYTYTGIKIILGTMIALLGSTMVYLSYIYKYQEKYQKNILIVDVGKKIIVNTIDQNPKDSIEIFMGTFLGNSTRNFYGDSIPLALDLIWQHELGSGKTIVSRGEIEIWSGAGWTGQPLFVIENNHPFLIQGSYDHTLKKIDALNGKLVWEYTYDDVLKGTGTIWEDPNPVDPMNRFLILQGARLGVGNSLKQDTIPSYRAISYLTGKEVWRLNVRKGPSFSRDVDGSALLWKDTVYIGLENGFFSTFTPGIDNLVPAGEFNYKQLLNEYALFNAEDIVRHRKEVVIESSPSKIGNHLYITTGSGHVYGYNLIQKKIDWVLNLGCDMNGSAVVTDDNCIIVTLEKEFIDGHGGAMKIDPSKSPENSIVWYLPTGNIEFASWEGGIVGSVSVNDHYKDKGEKSMACISALDGNLYLVEHTKINETLKVKGPDNNTMYNTPVVLSKALIGSTISTPIFVNNRICAAGYFGIHIFEINKNYQLNKLSSFSGVFESTPTAYQGKIYIAAKNGYLYCLGKGTIDGLTTQDLLQ